jgi:glycerol-3-phosphate dehydrogenase (NAD(P)+)
MGARPSTFAGLTGIGDLVVTCTIRHSRNRYLGEQIGRGRSLAAVQAEMQMIAEGVRTTASVRALAQRYAIEMPITEAVYAILFEDKKPRDAVHELMTRSAKQEDWLPHPLEDPQVS